MKKIILTLGLFFNILTVYSQIGVLTLKSGIDYVPINMWYTINEKDRENQMYYTSNDEEIIGEVLRKTLFDVGVSIDNPSGRDGLGDLYWDSNLGNGYTCQVFFSKKNDNYTITILIF